MTPPSAKHCTRCILRLDTIEHNQDGVCILCQQHEDRPWDVGKQDFIRTVKNHCGKDGTEYDVLCPITGGKDSMFAFYCLTRFVPEARVLAFTWDNGFHRSWKNIERAVDATGVRHVVLRYGDTAENAVKVTHACQQIFGLACFICATQSMGTLWAALKFKTPLVLSGLIRGQVGPPEKEGIYKNSAYMRDYAQKILKHEALMLDEILDQALPEEKTKIISHIIGPIRDAVANPTTQFPNKMCLGFYFDWNKNEEKVVKLLKDAFGFEKPTHAMSHTSCELDQFRGSFEYWSTQKAPRFWKKKKQKPTRMEYETSAIVRAGAISRKEGFQELKDHGFGRRIPEETIKLYLKKTGASRREFIAATRKNKGKEMKRIRYRILQKRIRGMFFRP